MTAVSVPETVPAPQPVALDVRGLGKAFPASHGAGERWLFRDLDFDLKRGDRLAILGRNGQGKSTFIKILGGVLPMSEGELTWKVRPSWPIGFGGGFQGSLSGLDNIRFLSRVYAANYDTVLERVENFAELGLALKQPVKHYSSGMRARLAFGLSLAIDFDCYLIDELIAVGDARFAAKCADELFTRRADRAFIMASHDMNSVASVCSSALIIESGQVKFFDDVAEAIDVYSWLRAA
ncbi:ABC transporter ATP-binding protein [Brevundimonas sp.]|uniref:ABC transporter ATP-binding protein n=1 Tax=Brevundimonas sp. TaxID=1871086 RepID=UPI00289F9386|nr:ABC transporter ATP-binding protein [Brevundimonas sp.]